MTNSSRAGIHSPLLSIVFSNMSCCWGEKLVIAALGTVHCETAAVAARASSTTKHVQEVGEVVDVDV